MVRNNIMSARVVIAVAVIGVSVFALGCQEQVADAVVLGETAKTAMISNVEIYNTGNMDLIESVISPQYIGHFSSRSEPVVGRKGFTDWIVFNRTAFSNFNVEINKMLAEGNMVAIQWTVTGVNDGMLMDMQPTGKTVSIKGLTLARVDNGKIAEEWITWDVLDMYRQLGIETPESMM